MNKILVLSITLLLLISGMPLAQAQEQNQNQAMGIPPDNPFYFFQGWMEGFGGLFRGGDPEFHDELAQRRQAEIQYLQQKNQLTRDPIKHLVAAISVGIYQGQPILDLDYKEDFAAHTDMNVIMTEQGSYIEIQGTAEDGEYTQEELLSMLELARNGIKQLINIQKQSLET